MHPQTVLDLFNLYKAYLEMTGNAKTIPLTQSALFRFTVPGWGGLTPQGKKLSLREVNQITGFLSALDKNKVLEAIEVQAQVFQDAKVDKARQRQPRYYVKKFVDWVLEEKLVEPPKVLKQNEDIHHSFFTQAKRKAKNKLTDRKQPYAAFVLGKVKGDFINKELQLELNKLEKFLKNILKCQSEDTRDRLTKGEILSLLGWLVREKKQPLDKLRLSSLIRVVNFRLDSKSFTSFEKYSMAKITADQDVRSIGEEVVDLCEQYFAWREEVLGSYSTETKANVVRAVIRTAKYLYHDQTDRGIARNYEDVPVIKRLQVYYCDLRENGSTDSVVPHSKKFVPWTKIIEILEVLRREADLQKFSYLDKRDGRYYARSRPQSSILSSYQKFLILAFLVLMPPDRQRTVRQLRYNHTLKCGLFNGGYFIPKEDLKSYDKYFWYITLGKTDYKIGKSQGQWYAAIPNFMFPDGKFFYQYLERWVYELRDLAKPKHDYLLFGDISKKPYNRTNFCNKVKHIFVRFTDIELNPHELRHLYNTHIRNKGATREELDSSALWMKQSEDIAAKRYSHQEFVVKFKPGIELCERINREIMESLTKR